MVASWEENRTGHDQRRERLDVIRSNKTTAQLKVSLSGMDFREMVLVNALEFYEHDLVIIDCPPRVDILHTAALVLQIS